jgi:WD repeat-containing protein 42A
MIYANENDLFLFIVRQVNCLEGHPHIPILATSGLDYDVKIWVPSCEKSPTMRSLATVCINKNTVVLDRSKLENN